MVTLGTPFCLLPSGMFCVACSVRLRPRLQAARFPRRPPSPSLLGRGQCARRTQAARCVLECR